MHMNNTFVMGGTGFIGTEVVKALVARGDRVYGLARSPATARRLRELGATPIEGDVYQSEKWLPNLPPLDYAINVLGFFNDPKPMRLSVAFAVQKHEGYTQWGQILIQLARQMKLKAAVHVTGTTIFEERDAEPITEKTPVRYKLCGFNRIAYSATQMMVEAIKGGLPIIVAVAPNVVYGPVPASSFEQVFVEPLRRNMIGIVGSGKNYIPTGHVEDVGRAIALVTDARHTGEFFLIAGDDAVTQREFLYAIAKGLGKKHVMRLPKPIVSIVGGKAAAEFMSLSQRVDNSKLKRAGLVLKHPRFMEEIDSVMAELLRAKGSRTASATVNAGVKQA
jgi:nucleoside-diphosphate-sugar epimerase